jgi:hypothetical protein
MNQVTNLIQWKNLSKEEQAGFDFEGYKYERQVNEEWEPFRDYDLSHNKHLNFVYRLVIEPDKLYVTDFEGDVNTLSGKFIIDENERDEVRISEYLSIRPATEAEVPKPALPVHVPEYRSFMMTFTFIDGVYSYYVNNVKMSNDEVWEYFKEAIKS